MKRYITLPETWDELTEADWRCLLRMRQQMIDRRLKVAVGDVRIETARMLLGNRGVSQRPDDPQWLVLVGQVAQTLDWLWQETDGGLSLVYRSTVNLLPQVKQWLGPLSHGADLTFGEFRMALAVLRNYEQNPSGRDLDVLAGLLYRPAASEQMQHERQLRRWPYDWDTFEQKEKRGRQMKRWQVWGIYAWMAYFCEYLTTGVFIIDGERVSFEPLFKRDETGDRRQEAGGGLQQICLTLAESHVFGTVRDVDNTPLLTVMQKLLMDYRTLRKLRIKN